ncbi:hypothetical protein FGRMN_366 [Fusarium graminum]|nr:hypothetical protein FGRMN_366 [Fusarium graminum]
MEPKRVSVIFFDLNSTLFDHEHSAHLAISSLKDRYASLEGKEVEELADVRKIHIFFAALGLPEPGLDEVQKFRDAYKAVYRANRRATSGSIATLVRLQEHGYRIAMTTNGQIIDQTAKAEAIGVLHLCERIITSEEAGHRKPDPRVFQYAIEQLGASFHTTHMIGDSVDSDVKGALDAQLLPIVYSPQSLDSEQIVFGQKIPIIRHMEQLLGHFGISNDATVCSNLLGLVSKGLVSKGIGMRVA